MKRSDFNTAMRAYEAMIQVITKHTPYKLSNDAPNSFGALQTSYARDGYLTILSDASDKTIFSTPKMNHLFRVWHDSVHILLCANFSKQGETDVMEWQLHEMLAALTAFGYSTKVQDDVTSIMTWDILGQVDYYYTHKKYVDDQKRFVLDNLGIL